MRPRTVPDAVRTPAVPAPGAHGDDAARVAKALGQDPAELLDLAVTLNPLAPDVLPVVRRHLGALRRYPDESDGRRALASALGVDTERLVLTNGGAEAIALVAAEHPSGWVEPPEFSLFERHLAAVDPGAPHWASNPNNPTGRLAAAGKTAAVWDEAFYAMATGEWTRGDGDAVVVGSLTKLLACPGLRIGYVVARDDAEAARLAARRPQWSVNSLAASALPELLAAVDIETTAAGITELRRQLVECLRRHGLVPLPSDAPWVLVPGAAGLRERLAPLGVLVRDCASFGLDGHVRIAVPNGDGLARLDAALTAAAGPDTRT